MSFITSSLPAAARRDLRTVVWARAISLLGDEMALVALLLRTQDGGGGAWPVVALLMAGTLPLVLLAPIIGRLVDRYDSRRLLVASGLGQLACCCVLAYQQRGATVLPLVALLGAGQAVNAATWQALLPRIVGVDRLPAALGRSQAAGTAAAILAPVLGGVLTGWYGARLPLLLDAASFAVITLAGLTISTRRGGLGNTAGAAGDSRGGLAVLRADRTLLRLVVMLSVFVLLAGMVNVVEIFLVRQSLHAGAGWYGVLGGGWGLGLLAGALLGGRLPSQTALLRAAVASCLGLAVALAWMGLAPSVGWLLPATALGGVCNGTLNVSIGALLGMRCPEAVRGRVGATVSGLSTAGQIGALLLGGLLAAALTPRAVFVLGGVLGVLVSLALGHPLLAASAAQPAQNPENAWPTSSANSSSGSAR
jgi:MFS family permease